MEQHRLPQVAGVVHPENAASIRVLEKAGLSYRGYTDKYYGMLLKYFAIDHRQYAESTIYNS